MPARPSCPTLMGPALLRRPRAGPLPDTVCELPPDEGVGDGHLLASAAARAAALHGREVEMSATDPAASIAPVPGSVERSFTV